MRSQSATKTNPAIREFADRLGAHSLIPLWDVLADLVTEKPTTAGVPFLWDYKTVRDFLIESGDLITAEQAERRVLALENPGLAGTASISEALYAGIQLVLPGEVAPAHRHVSTALRFVIECEGGYTAVNGEKLWMTPGDLVLTPNWHWHDHHHDGEAPAIWLDGLDAPLVRFMGASFVESFPQASFPSNNQVNTTALYGNNMMPLSGAPTESYASLMHYPYARTRDTLESLCQSDQVDPHFGIKMEHRNPATGGSITPTLSAFAQLLLSGTETANYQATDSAVYSVVEGRGQVFIGDDTFSFGPRDHFVVPCWFPHHFKVTEETILFSFTDKAAQTQLDLWRENRSAA